MDLKTFEKIMADMENAKDLLDEALISQEKAVANFTELTMKSLKDPRYIPLVEESFDNLQAIDSLIQSCQDRIYWASQALTSDNPN